MSCGRPVILGVDGQARKIVEEAQAGVFVEPEDVRALVQTITRLAGDAELRETLGSNGRRFIVQHFSRQQTAETYLNVLADLVRKGSSNTVHTEPISPQ